MKMKYIKVCAAFIAAASLSMPAMAQDAKTLDELLLMIQNSKLSESEDYRQREAEFKRDQRKQATQLAQAKRTKAAEERRSDRLEQEIRENDLKLAALREQRDKRLGSLKELFGHLTGAAGDIRATLNQSVVSAQIPGRTEFLDELIDKMSSDTRCRPSRHRKAVYEQQREMVESGRVVKFNRTVLLADGSQQEMGWFESVPTIQPTACTLSSLKTAWYPSWPASLPDTRAARRPSEAVEGFTG